MAKARKGNSVKKGIKHFIYGQQGTWKSSMSLDLMKMTNENGRPLRVAYIDTEFGSVDNFLEDLELQGIDTENLLMIYSNVEEEIIEWLDDLMADNDLYVDGEEEGDDEVLVLDSDGNKFIADAIVIDSLTVVQDTTKYGMIQVSEKRASVKASKKESITATEKFVAQATAGMELKDYDKLNHRGKNINRKLIANTDKIIVATSREKILYEKKKVNGQIEAIPVGYIPDCYKGSQYEYYTVLRMFEDEEDGSIKAQVERKDRTKVFQQGEIIENPSMTLWQSVINGNKGKKKGVVLNKSYNDSVDSETKNLIKGENKVGTLDIDNEGSGVSDTPLTVDDYLSKIKDIRESMSPTKKRAIPSKLRAEGLPVKPSDDLDLETVKKMYDVINK